MPLCHGVTSSSVSLQQLSLFTNYYRPSKGLTEEVYIIVMPTY